MVLCLIWGNHLSMIIDQNRWSLEHLLQKSMILYRFWCNHQTYQCWWFLKANIETNDEHTMDPSYFEIFWWFNSLVSSQPCQWRYSHLSSRRRKADKLRCPPKMHQLSLQRGHLRRSSALPTRSNCRRWVVMYPWWRTNPFSFNQQ